MILWGEPSRKTWYYDHAFCVRKVYRYLKSQKKCSEAGYERSLVSGTRTDAYGYNDEERTWYICEVKTDWSDRLKAISELTDTCHPFQKKHRSDSVVPVLAITFRLEKDLRESDRRQGLLQDCNKLGIEIWTIESSRIRRAQGSKAMTTKSKVAKPKQVKASATKTIRTNIKAAKAAAAKTKSTKIKVTKAKLAKPKTTKVAKASAKTTKTAKATATRAKARTTKSKQTKAAAKKTKSKATIAKTTKAAAAKAKAKKAAAIKAKTTKAAATRPKAAKAKK